MNVNPFFSIIVPVFNQEKQLRDGVKSILAQTFSDFEVLIVDDASTDNSISLIKEMIECDERFRFISQKKNSSVLMARKAGMTNALGRYVMSVDIDDYIEENALEVIHKRLIQNPVDILTFAIAKEPSKEIVGADNRPDMLKSLLETDIHPWLPQRVFRGEIVKKGVGFIKDGYCNMAEDYYISSILNTFAESYDFIDDVLYHYNIGIGMSTNQANCSLDKFKVQISHLDFAINGIKEFLESNNPDYVKYVNQTAYSLICGTIWQYGGRVKWSDIIDYAKYLSELGRNDVVDWICEEFIPQRAVYVKQAKKTE